MPRLAGGGCGEGGGARRRRPGAQPDGVEGVLPQLELQQALRRPGPAPAGGAGHFAEDGPPLRCLHRKLRPRRHREAGPWLRRRQGGEAGRHLRPHQGLRPRRPLGGLQVLRHGGPSGRRHPLRHRRGGRPAHAPRHHHRGFRHRRADGLGHHRRLRAEIEDRPRADDRNVHAGGGDLLHAHRRLEQQLWRKADAAHRQRPPAHPAPVSLQGRRPQRLRLCDGGDGAHVAGAVYRHRAAGPAVGPALSGRLQPSQEPRSP